MCRFEKERERERFLTCRIKNPIELSFTHPSAFLIFRSPVGVIENCPLMFLEPSFRLLSVHLANQLNEFKNNNFSRGFERPWDSERKSLACSRNILWPSIEMRSSRLGWPDCLNFITEKKTTRKFITTARASAVQILEAHRACLLIFYQPFAMFLFLLVCLLRCSNRCLGSKQPGKRRKDRIIYNLKFSRTTMFDDETK